MNNNNIEPINNDIEPINNDIEPANNNKKITYYRNRKIQKLSSHYLDLYYEYIEKSNNFINVNSNGDRNVDFCNYSERSTILHKLVSFDYTIITDKINMHNFFGQKYFLPEVYNNSIIRGDINWFCKPRRGALGANIIITKDPSNIGSDYIIQREIIPRLIDGYKFDLRIYVVHQIENCKFNTWVYNDGLVRIAPEKYFRKSTDHRSMLCNTSLLKKTDNIEKTQKLFSTTNNYHLYLNKIVRIVKWVQKDIRKKSNFKNTKYLSEFHLFGYDIIFTNQNHPFIMEINATPHSIRSKNPVQISNMKRKMSVNIVKLFIENVIYKNIDIEDNNFIRVE